ncbi:MAG: gliding motility-associated C-terminal domain-containing protein [Flavobacteriales bacterium]
MLPNTKTNFLVVFILIFFSLNLLGQTPTTCFEIESVLVDACGNNEGENEMVRFKVGPSNLNVNNLNVNWPNNSFLGICKNSTTASKVASLNSSIVGCGFLKEPASNILPAGSSVILLTSTNFNVSANSFSNLNDTMYVIFQCVGNTAGHFANYNSTSSTRTLTMSFSSPSGCFDMVSYDRSLLVDASGTPSNADGSRVDYDWNGNATYTNGGCSAPIINNSVDITSNNLSICPGDTLPLTSTITGNLNNVQWAGNNGNFSSTSSANTSYYSAITDNSDFYIYLLGTTSCGVVLKDSVLVQVGGNATPVTIISSGTELCNGDSILLTANGSGNYTWSTGSTSNSIYVSNAGNYSVTSTSNCGNSNDNITITNSPTINLSLTTPQNQICTGNSIILTASGAPNYTWFNNTTGTNTSVQNAGSYYVIGYNNCYRDSQSVSITVINPPVISISSSDPDIEICLGETINLTASGSNNYLWNTSDTSSTITVNAANTYTVSSSNLCGTDTKSITINAGVVPIINITGDSILCNNEIIYLTAAGTGNVLWSNGSQNQTTSFNTGGQVYVIASNNCGSDTAYHTIQSFGINTSFTSDYVYGSDIPVIVNFNNTSSNATSYNWNFGDGSTSVLENPSHTYTANGEFNVILTASNQYCEDSFETILIFDTPNGVFIPNVFTPNNDDVNDVFEIIGENIATIECSIFNRWGERLYTWDNLAGFWDGKYNGTFVTDGTYFYVANIVWKDDSKETLRGHISVLK